jgi:uncharacterized membrane protein YvlD (DUF360 family)
MARRGGFRTQAPKKATLIISLILWLIGVLAFLGVIHPPANMSTLGFWCLVIAGLLMMLGSVLDGL